MKFKNKSHYGNYSIFFIKGIGETFVSNLLERTPFPDDFGPEKDGNGFILSEAVGDGYQDEYGFRFTIDGAYPDFAVTLSDIIGNDVIVIGEGAWDLNYFVVAKNGEQIHLPVAIETDERNEDGYVDAHLYN